MSRPVDHERRAAFLSGALGYLSENGLANLSLRPLAQALGTSDRMLVYYFGTKEELVAQTLAASQPDVAAYFAAADELSSQDLALSLWQLMIGDGPQRPRVRLMLEVMALAITQPSLYSASATSATRAWVQPVSDAIAQREGGTPESAEARATILVSGLKGLALDYFVTGDHQRVDSAARQLIAAVLS